MVTTRRGAAAATPPPPTPEDIAAAAAAEATRRNNAIKPFQFGGADAKLRGVAARPVDNLGGVPLKDQCLETYDNDGTSWRMSDLREALVSDHERALEGQAPRPRAPRALSASPAQSRRTAMTFDQ